MKSNTAARILCIVLAVAFLAMMVVGLIR